MQNLWGARYIDDLVSRRRDANRDGDYSDAGDGIFYAITDVQFSVVATLTSTGKLHERVAYDSYGTARHHWKDDVDGDGDVDSSDKSAVTALLNKAIYQSGYNPAADIDRSGTIDSADASLVSSKAIAALPAGEISDRTSTGPDSNVGYDGYVFNVENLLYTVRFRHYDTGLGWWLERDAIRYYDGMHRYQYVVSSPIALADSVGLAPIWNSASPPDDAGQFDGSFDRLLDGFEKKKHAAIGCTRNDLAQKNARALRDFFDKWKGYEKAFDDFLVMAECMAKCMITEGTYPKEVLRALINQAIEELNMPLSITINERGELEFDLGEETGAKLILKMVKRAGKEGEELATLIREGAEIEEWDTLAKCGGKLEKAGKRANKFMSEHGDKLVKVAGNLAKYWKAAGAASAIIRGAAEASEKCKKKCEDKCNDDKDNK